MLVASLDPNAETTVKVTDFSISREMPAQNMKVTLNTGTSQWRAPEICKGERPTRATDVYSFGVIMWEIAVREIPFTEIKWHHEIDKAVAGGARPKIPDVRDLPVAVPSLG